MRYDPDNPPRIEPITEFGMLDLIRAMDEWKKRAMEEENKAIFLLTIFMSDP